MLPGFLHRIMFFDDPVCDCCHLRVPALHHLPPLAFARFVTAAAAYRFRDGTDAQISPEGRVFDVTSDNRVQVCAQCLSFWKRNDQPPNAWPRHALWNNLNPGSIPPPLRGLSHAEAHSLALVRVRAIGLPLACSVGVA